MTSIDIANLYFVLSNEGNLDKIESFFHENAQYHSDTVGTHNGRGSIMRMMRIFFEKFEHLQWSINGIKEIDESTLEINFNAIFQNQTEKIEKNGIEKMTIRDGYITYIEVKNN